MPWVLQPKFQPKQDEETEEKKKAQVFHRYYHLFKEEELMDLVDKSGYNFNVVDKGYDKDNWYVEIIKC